MNNFVKLALDAGGDIAPLIIPCDSTNGTGIFNPSIYYDEKTEMLLCNIRHCQVTIYHSKENGFEHQWGPLTYLNPENDITLTTTNYFCEIGPDLLVKEFSKIDFSKLDGPSIWDFKGLEDCRVFRWEGKLYICGVRRDTTPNGQGRMELCQLDQDIKEISRFRIPAPEKDDTYCEKNWMPIIDMPYHFVKWSNPTEVVKVDPINKTCETVHLGSYVEKPFDYRGGSQVITLGDYRVALTHTCNLFKSEQGKKNAIYEHSFIVWDKDWNVVKYGDRFSFMGIDIEFCTGMTEYRGDVLISFGTQDNSAYLLRVPMKFILDFIK